MAEKSDWLKNTQKLDEIMKRRPLPQHQVGLMTPGQNNNNSNNLQTVRTNVDKTLEKLKKKGNKKAVREIEELDNKLEKFKQHVQVKLSTTTRSSGNTSETGVVSSSTPDPKTAAQQRKIHGTPIIHSKVKVSLEGPARIITSFINPNEFAVEDSARAPPLSAVETTSTPGVGFNQCQSDVGDDLMLENNWAFHYDRRGYGSKGSMHGQQYENNLILLGTAQTVQMFWRYFNHIKLPSELELNANVHVFKDGIKPMWEDPKNMHGGKWTIMYPPASDEVTQAWIRVVLGAVGEMLDDADNVCGVVLARRGKADRVSVWIKDIKSPESVLQVGVNMVKVTGLDPTKRSVSMEFQSHAESLFQSGSNNNSNNGKSQNLFTFDEVKKRL